MNKVSSKVELRFDLPGTRALAVDVKARLLEIARGRLDAEGQILLTSDAQRDQPQNLEEARAKLAALIVRALVPPRPRHKTKPTRGSKERRLDAKKRRGATKRVRNRSDD